MNSIVAVDNKKGRPKGIGFVILYHVIHYITIYTLLHARLAHTGSCQVTINQSNQWNSDQMCGNTGRYPLHRDRPNPQLHLLYSE